MHVLISHPSLVQSLKLRKQLGALHTVGKVSTAATLTKTYDIAEHQRPDCVLICASLVVLDEFAFLSSLFDMLGIAFVVIGDTPHGVSRRSTTQWQASLPSDSPTELLQEAIKQATNQARPALRKAAAMSDCGSYHRKAIILIGASTGGIDALLQCLRCFPENCPPTLIVQHTGSSFVSSLVGLLDRATQAHVVTARDGQSLEAGRVYLAPSGNQHLGLTPTGHAPMITLQNGAPVSGHRPSVDTLFTSTLPFASHVAAALLTGMGRDGAAGLVQLRHAGAHTIGQDEATSIVYGMPRIAMERGGVAEQLPIAEIGPALLRASMGRAGS